MIMKPILIFTLILFIMQNSYAQITDTMKTRKPEIDDSFEVWDFSLTAGDNTIQDKHVRSGPGYYHVLNEKRKIIIRYEKNGRNGISGYDFSLNPIIGIHKEFYPNGNIRTKGIFCSLGFRIGKWHYFSEDGELIEPVDYDAGYEFTYELVFDFCEKRGISLDCLSGCFNTGRIKNKKETSITKRKNQDDILIWQIEYYIESGTNERGDNFYKYKTFQLDAKDGAIIKEHVFYKMENPDLY